MASSSQLIYKVRRATRVSDPDAEWRDGKLYLTLQGEEVEAVVLTKEEEAEAQLTAQQKKISLERALLKKRLLKGGALKYNLLKKENRIPPNPAEASFHRRQTEVIPPHQGPQPGPTGSLFSNVLGAAGRRLFGAHSLPAEQWVLDAYKLYELPHPAEGESFIANLARELGSDIVQIPEGAEAYPGLRTILLRQKDLADALDPSTSYSSEQEKLQATSQAALQKKIHLLSKLGLISRSEKFKCEVKAEDFAEEIAKVIDTSQIVESGDEGNGGQETEESEQESEQDSQLRDHLNKSLTEGVPHVHRQDGFYYITIWPSYYEGPTYTDGCYWQPIVENYQRNHPDCSTQDILKEHLLSQIEDSKPHRNLNITRADIRQQLRLETYIRPGARPPEGQWTYIILQAAGRKLKLALEVEAIQNPIEEFQVAVAVNFLTLVEKEYYLEFFQEELELPAMGTPPPAAVCMVNIMIKELQKLKDKVDQHGTQPLDIVDVEHTLEQLDRVDAIIANELTTILNTPGLTEAQKTLYTEQMEKMVSQRSEVGLALARIKKALPISDQQENPNQQQAGPSMKLHLPKVQFKTFKGTWSDWLEFKDQINNLVVAPSDAQLPRVQKFQLLRQSLEDAALDVIKGIPVIGTNFDRAWKTLCDRYDNPTRLKEHYHDQIANLKPMTKTSAAQLRNMFSTLNTAREQLTRLGATAGDDYLVSRLVSGFDGETRNHYEMRPRPPGQDDSTPATWAELEVFVNRRCTALDNMRGNAYVASVRHPPKEERSFSQRKSTAMTTQRQESSTPKASGTSTDYRKCKKCAGSHPLYKCEKFKKLPGDKRREFVREERLCFVCLGSGHVALACKSKLTCRTCQKRHHSLLHVGAGGSGPSTPRPKKEESEVQALTAHKDFSTVILPTARMWVEDATEEWHPYRALLDTGSQSSFITERAVQYLRLPRNHARVQITGIGNGAAPQCKGYVTLCIRSIRDPTIKMETTALILPNVMSDTPMQQLPTGNWSHLKDLPLADPEFGRPGRVDVVLGADVAFQALTGARLLGQPNEPVAHATCFGWVIGGSGGSLQPAKRISANVATQQDVSIDVLQQFWGREGLCEEQLPDYQKAEDKLCEEIFQKTTTRLEDGKLQVSFPFKKDPPDVGPSRTIALKRLAGTEARLARDPGLRKQYEEFMEDYEAQGHMEEVKTSQELDVYLPHHPIIRKTALTTKLRVVFDASAKTANGNSLNSQQLVGPVIQDDLFSILTRFRLHKVAINGDIEKMYRQIWIHPDQQRHQKILWRRKPEDPVSEFKLKTVTYGTASAPWLATRALKWIAEKEQDNYPAAARIIAQDHYMDDLLSGMDTPEEAHRIQEEVNKILLSYGLPLRKWASNDEYVIRAITGDQAMLTNPEEIVKTLGLKWSSKEDSFHFKVKLKNASSLTKRAMISEIACTFDPLGFAAPVIVVAKMLYQQVWATKTDWDEELPEVLAKKYQTFRQKLSGLESISLPRWLGSLSTDNIELHVFTDASERAYGAAIYLRVLGSSGVASNLVAAKTRVASLSKISLPRLELMGAVLGTQLMEQVVKALRRTIQQRFYWTDSMITLAWIQASPERFKTFVANRIAAIQERSKIEDWRHVGTKDNPADLASRGIMPQELTGEVKQMWFHGPTWLRDGTLPAKLEIPEAEEECKKIQVLHGTAEINLIVQLIDRKSSFQRLWRIVAWMRRFIFNCANKKRNGDPLLSALERQEAINKLISAVQHLEWPREIISLQQLKLAERDEEITRVMKTSNINNLAPILDAGGILRVGGRLEYSNRDFASKHPAILPYGHLAKIYLRDLHARSLHAGPTLLLATARQQVWPIRGPQLAREVVKKCLECTRWKGATLHQQMGHLPSTRTEGHRAFHVTGVDYAGPVLVKTRKGRGGTTVKTWISVFVCFASKAIHLELVSELSSEAFIAALRRFVARRGLPQELHSDNGTNFVGADKELKTLLTEQKNQQQIVDACLQQGIDWKFIPPSAPHQGGLWEAAVKSVKHHLRRVLGDARLTYEEFNTVLCQVEAQVNSRPLSPLTEDSSDLEFLTPGHFLIGKALTAAPDPSLVHYRENRLSRWQYLQRLQQSFWEKWSLEYLSAMQKRFKWKYPQVDMKLGTLVIIKEDNVAPTQWRRGRVINLHTGKDGKTRVVTLRTSTGEITRPIVKLIQLG